MKALGMIEVYGFSHAVAVADLCAKTADVKVIAFDRNRPFAPGFPVPLIIVVKIEGETAAVQAAISAAAEYSKSKGNIVNRNMLV